MKIVFSYWRYICFVAAICILGACEAPAASAGSRAPRPPLRVFTYHGFWYSHLGIDRAFARMGGVIDVHSWFGPGLPPPRPESAAAIAAYDMIIAGGYEVSTLSPAVQKALVEFVRNGGALVVFGGPKVFTAAFRGTALEAVCPVMFPRGYDFIHVPSGVPLVPGAHAEAWVEAATPWKDQPRVFWLYDMMPKPDTDVVVTADRYPFVVVGKFGRGTVAVCAGTVMGTASDGQTPFWIWQAWPGMLAGVFERMTAREYADARLPVKIDPAQLTLPPICSDRAAALHLLKSAVEMKDDLPPVAATALFLAVRRHVDAAFVDPVEDLIASRQPNRIALGLWLLGQTSAPGMVERLTRIAESGDAAFGARRPNTNDAELEAMLVAPVADGGVTVDIKHDPSPTDRRDVYLIQRAALEGLGNSGAPAALPVLRQFAQKLAPSRTPIALPLPVARRSEDDLLDEAILGAVLCGATDQCRPLISLLVTNRCAAVAMYMKGWQEKNPKNREALHAAAKDLALRNWRDCARLDGVPSALLPECARVVADSREEWVTPFAFQLFGRASRRTVPAGVGPLLRQSAILSVSELVIGDSDQ